MIDWIDDGCKHWGQQMRMMYLGKDGWPPRTVLAKMIEEGVLGAAANHFMQYLPECMDAEAIRWNIGIRMLDEGPRMRLFIHYVVIGKGKVKAARMGEARSVYYEHLEQAHKRLSGVFNRIAEQERQKKSVIPDKIPNLCLGSDFETASYSCEWSKLTMNAA